MARRRQGDLEDNTEKIAISLKLPKKLLDRIDSYWKEKSSLFSGRTHFIEEACSFYLTCERCSKCGNLNTPQSKLCSYCGHKLEGEEYLEIKNSVIRELSYYDKIYESIISHKEQYDDLDNKIKWYLDKLDEKRKSIISYILPDYYYVINTVMGKVDSFLEYREYYKRQFENGESLTVPHALIEKKYSDVSFTISPFPSIGDVDNQNPTSPEYRKIYDEYQSVGINHAYYGAKLAISNLETVSTQDLRVHHLALVSEGLNLQSYLDDMIMGLNQLRGIEKMIDILPEIQESGSISISRREQQD